MYVYHYYRYTKVGQTVQGYRHFSIFKDGGQPQSFLNFVTLLTTEG